MILFIFVAYILHKKNSKNHNHGGQTKPVTRHSNLSESEMPSREPTLSPRKTRAPNPMEQAARINHLNALIQSLVPLSKNQIWDLEDIGVNVEEYLNDDLQYIAKQLSTPLFSTSVWDLHEKIKNCQLANDQIIKILESGTDNIIDTFMEYYAKSTTWTMSSLLLDKIIAKNPLWTFRFTNYSKSVLKSIIDRLSVYELLGYRLKALKPDEDFEDSFIDLQKSTEDDEVIISYYESIDMDIIHYLETNYPNETELRQIAFKKIISESSNVIDMVHRLENISDEEIKAIMDRNYDAEISVLFDVCDVSSIANSFPPLYAVKVALQLVACDYEYEVNEYYDFTNISTATYQEIISSLSADELLAYDDRGDGNYDIIKLFEDHSIGDEELRKLAFSKICESKDMSDAIARWDNVTEDEVKIIMERNVEEEINALFGRDDSEDIICSLPEELAIKIALELVYSDSSETVRDNYSFGDRDAFIKVINELSAGELLGFKPDPDDSESYYNDADYDIIKLIEDHMNDDSTLRDLAFAKMSGYKDMSEAIDRWDNVTEEETEKIINRSIEEEMNALMERDDFDTSNLPDSFVIKQYLLDDIDSIRDEYTNRIDDGDFVNKVEKMVKKLSSKKLSGKDKEGAVEDLSDDIIIKAELQLFDLSECSFDGDDISSEFTDRINNSIFKQKVEDIISQLS